LTEQELALLLYRVDFKRIRRLPAFSLHTPSADLPDLRLRQFQEQVDQAANAGRIYGLEHRPRRLMRSLTIWIMLR
jgi:hypothetical protein